MSKRTVDRPLVFPTPQRMTVSKGRLDLGKTVGVSVSGDAKPRSVVALVKRITGLKAVAADDATLRIAVGADTKRPAEGYALKVDAKAVTISAADDRGLFYALQTLAQLIGEDATLPCVSITDAPRFPMRGAHIYTPARKDLPFFKRLIEFLARYKFNTLFLEISAGMKYDSHPEINEAWERMAEEAAGYPASQSRMQNGGISHKNSIHIELGGGSYLTKDEMRTIRKWCEANRIEIIPEVQSLSHSYWLLNAYPDLAEDKDDPYPDTYCPSNPKVYKILFDCMQEVVDVFEPRFVSIGHDEYYTSGLCPRCQGKNPGDLYAGDINRIHDFLAERGARIAMWSEKLHTHAREWKPEWKFTRYGKPFRGWMPDATAALKQIPRDILLMNWYAGVDPESVRLLREEGFEQILGNYSAAKFTPDKKAGTGISLDALITENSRGEAVDPKAAPMVLGAEVSTWHAPVAKEFSPRKYLYTIQTLWAKEMSPKLVQRMDEEIVPLHRCEGHFLHDTKSALCAPGKKTFRPVDMKPVADIVFDGRSRMWGGFGTMDLRNIPAGDVTLAGVPFHVLDYPKTAQCPFIAVDANMRNSWPVKVNAQAAALVFLHTSSVKPSRQSPWTSLHLPEPILAAYIVRYQDGKTVEVPIIHDWNVANVSAGETPFHGCLAWTGKNAAGGPISLYTAEWANPRPRAAIESVTMEWRGGWLPGDVACAAMTVVK